MELLSLALNCCDQRMLIVRGVTSPNCKALINRRLWRELDRPSAELNEKTELSELDLREILYTLYNAADSAQFISYISSPAAKNLTEGFFFKINRKNGGVDKLHVYSTGSDSCVIFKDEEEIPVVDKDDTLKFYETGLMKSPLVALCVEFFGDYYIVRMGNEAYDSFRSVGENIIGRRFPEEGASLKGAAEEFCNIYKTLDESNPVFVREWTRNSKDEVSDTRLISTTCVYVGRSKNGNKLFINFTEDNTVRKTHENMMQDRNLLMTNLFENSPAVMGLMELCNESQIKVRFTNPAGQHFANSTLRDGADSEVSHLYKEALQKVRLTDRPVSLEAEAGGDCMSISFNHFKDNMFCFVGFDITEMKKLQKSLEKTRDELRYVRSNFLGTMSHEIRTPLFGVIGSLDLMAKENVSSEVIELLRIGKVCSQQLLVVINDILDYSKMEDNKMTIEEIPFSIQQPLRDAFEIVSVDAEKKNIELIYDYGHSVPYRFETIPYSLLDQLQTMEDASGVGIQPDMIVGDPIRLRQILVNLLSNAVKFSSSGEIIIRVQTFVDPQMEASKDEIKQQNGLEDIDPKKSSYILHFSVEDCGIGISQENLGKLFQPFSQADSTTTRKFGGSGLGLSISKRLSELMGGEMWCSSQVKKGSVFHFTIRTSMLQPYKFRVPSLVLNNQLRQRFQSLPTTPTGTPPTTPPPVTHSRSITTVTPSLNPTTSSSSAPNSHSFSIFPSASSSSIPANSHQPNTILVLTDTRSKLSKSMAVTLRCSGFNVMETTSKDCLQILMDESSRLRVGLKMDESPDAARAYPRVVALFTEIPSHVKTVEELKTDFGRIGRDITEKLDALRISLVIVSGSNTIKLLERDRSMLNIPNPFLCIRKPIVIQNMMEVLHKINERLKASTTSSIRRKGLNNIQRTTSASLEETPVAEERPIETFDVLVAEDNPLNRKIMTRLLTSIGIRQIKMVTDGFEALEAAKSHVYDIILMDVMMPGMSGIEATERIRAEIDGDHQTTIVGLTADAFKENQQNCLQAGMNGFLTKPINAEELKVALKEWCGKAKIRS